MKTKTRRGILLLVGLLSVLNGVTMLVDPVGWYERVPGVAATGPFNHHFVLDIGLAFIASGAGLLAAAIRWALWPAGLAGSVFLALHALLHLWGMAMGRSQTVLFDLALIVVPAVLAVAACWPPQETRDAYADRSKVAR